MKVIRSTLLTLVIAGSCVGTAEPMLGRLGAGLRNYGRSLAMRGQHALFSTARRQVPRVTRLRLPVRGRDYTQCTTRSGSTDIQPASWMRSAKKWLAYAANNVGINAAWFASWWKAPSEESDDKLPLELKQIIANADVGAFIDYMEKSEDEKLKEKVVDYCTEHFSRIEPWILFHVAKVAPGESRRLLPCVKQHFSLLSKTESGAGFLKRMLLICSHNAKDDFAALALENFVALMSTERGMSLIRQIMCWCPDVVQKYAGLAAQNIVLLSGSYRGREFIEQTMQEHSNTVQGFVQAALDNFLAMLENDDSYLLLKKIVLEIQPTAARDFVQLAAQNVTKLNDRGFYLLKGIIRKCDQGEVRIDMIQRLVQSVAKNLGVLYKSNEGRSFLEHLLHASPDNKEKSVFVLSGQRMGELFLKMIMQEYPALLPEMVRSMAKELIAVSQSPGGYHLLRETLEAHSNAAKEFAVAAVQNLVMLSESADGCRLLEKVIDRAPGTVKDFATAAAERLVDLSRTEFGVSILEKIIRKYPNAEQLFVPFGIRDFAQLIETHNGSIILDWLEWQRPDVQDNYARLIKQNFVAWRSNPHCLNVLRSIMCCNNEIEQEFLPLVLSSFVEITGSGAGCDLLSRLVHSYPEAMKEIVPLSQQMSKQRIGELSETLAGRELLMAIASSFPHEARNLLGCLQELDIEEDDFITLLQVYDKRHRGEKLSQSETHILKNGYEIATKQPINGELWALQTEVMEQERKIMALGYVPFYHGQDFKKYPIILLDSFLHEVRTGSSLDGFLFLHTIIDAARKGNGFFRRNTESNMRERLVREGRETDEDRNRMLFLNDSIRGNCELPGSRTFPDYFRRGNVGNMYRQPASILQDVFSAHGFGDCYSAFSYRLQQWCKRGAELSKYNVLYLIAIPRENVNKVVIPVYSGGGKVSLPFRLEGKTIYESDMEKIVPTLSDPDSYPEEKDRKEYVAIMTHDQDGLLNPACGAKMFAYMIPTDEKAYQEWLAEWENLKSSIRQYIEDHRLAQAEAHSEFFDKVGVEFFGA